MKKSIAITIEVIPIISAVVSAVLIRLPGDSSAIRGVILVTTLLAFFGFAAFLVARKYFKEDKTVRILGILDWLATLSVWGTYLLAGLVFGL